MSEEREAREPTEEEQADIDEATRMLLGMGKPREEQEDGEAIPA